LALANCNRRFEELKAKLASEGLFRTVRKRPLPELPLRIGLVTSPEGAAVRDFIRIANDRFEGLQLKIYPGRGAGQGARGQAGPA
jgi:exodeoxyribonuclease VII large subunit